MTCRLAVEFREQARPLLGHGARAPFELREQSGEQRLTLVDIALECCGRTRASVLRKRS